MQIKRIDGAKYCVISGVKLHSCNPQQFGLSLRCDLSYSNKINAFS